MIAKAFAATLSTLLAYDACAKEPAVTIQTESGTAAQCKDFKKNSDDGSWTPGKYIIISSGDCSVIIGTGQMSFLPGIPSTCGADIGLLLQRKCAKSQGRK